MPISYPSIPPWLHPADPLRAIEGGALLGQRIAESNQRAAQEYMMMQQRQSEFAQHMAMQERQLEQAQVMQQQQFQAEQEIHHQNQLQKEQQLAVENAYKQAQIGLGKQKLELTTQAAAKKFQTQQMIQSEINTDTQSMIAEEGMDPDEARQKATVRAYMRHATDLGLNPQGLAQLAKSSGEGGKGYKVEDIQTDRGTYKAIVNPSGAANIFERPEKEAKVPDMKFSVKPGDPLDPSVGPSVDRISGVTAAQLRGLGITNVGKFVAPESAAPVTNAPAAAPVAPEPTAAPVGPKRYRYDPATGKIEQVSQAEPDQAEEEDASVTA